jgi:peptidoglycan/xylan/chitin deacetylase (PgdA/CDA1 family)
MLLLILLTLLIILLFLAYVIYKPPSPVINFFQHKYPSIIFQVPTTQRVLALTIDDAPSPHTPQILDLLKAHNAKATFFIIGSQASSPSDRAVLERIHAEGHETGNHAMFDEPSVSLPLAELKHQMQDVEKLLPENDGGRKWFRPGSGFFSKEMLGVVEGMGYRMALGSVYPHDATIPSARINAGHVLGMVREGAVVIVHDRRSYSVDEIGRILKGLEDGGWRVESLGGLLKVAEEENVKKGG